MASCQEDAHRTTEGVTDDIGLLDAEGIQRVQGLLAPEGPTIRKRVVSLTRAHAEEIDGDYAPPACEIREDALLPVHGALAESVQQQERWATSLLDVVGAMAVQFEEGPGRGIRRDSSILSTAGGPSTGDHGHGDEGDGNGNGCEVPPRHGRLRSSRVRGVVGSGRRRFRRDPTGSRRRSGPAVPAGLVGPGHRDAHRLQWPGERFCATPDHAPSASACSIAPPKKRSA